MTDALVFLVDVDNTLLDNDRIQRDIREHFDRELGSGCGERYWDILDNIFGRVGYRDYLEALQQYRDQEPLNLRLLKMSSYLLDFPFADRLYPRAREVLRRLREWRQTVILSDGDVVFQPRKVERSGLAEEVEDRVLIYVHKEEALADIERRYPAKHYILIDDKLRILSTVKKAWGERVTTVFPRQGSFANDPKVLALYPQADVTIESIAELLDRDLPSLAARK